MNVNELMLESLQLLALGMGSVFIILSLLIIIITVIAKLVPEPEVVMPKATASVGNDSINSEHVAAIQAAIHQYRKTRNQ